MADSSIATHYLTVMESMSHRLLACRTQLAVIRADPSNIENLVRMDCVALQVRKFCELLLLASTLVHVEEGHSPETTHWRPKDAFRELEKFNTFPLPLPLENQIDFAGGAKRLFPASRPMPISTLAAIYGQCGNIIHVPPAAKVLAEKIPPFDFDKFMQWVDGFHRLLTGHILFLPKIRKVLVCTWTGRAEYPPQAFFGEGDGEALLHLAGLKEFDLLKP